MAPKIKTQLTELLGIQHPILLAGMARTSSGELAAAVSNAGGLGVIGGLGYTPKQLQEIIDDLKSNLRDPSLPFGVDLALPKLGDGARKTNYDYTSGQLDTLIDITINSGAKLFVSAVGVPPPHVIKKLHDAGILIMNMVGAPKHAQKALEAGVDMVCAQGGEGGGHTGSIATSILVPAVCDVAKNYISPLTGKPALVVAAGGIRDGRSVAAALMQGAQGVWVGTRFVASVEAGCSRAHKDEVVTATFEDTVRTLVVSGRPMRVKANDYIKRWERQPDKILALTEQGIIPYSKDIEDGVEDADRPFLMGQVAAVINKIQPAAEIVDEMISGAYEMLKRGSEYVGITAAKL
ncbi:hypothetical protein GX51_00466 [Blastomyces parvus]|uniref:Uncharacterized protein n=1 Tax=Blastomyces parvus TaxID=2060905 RepID=A0A2B7XMA7_9EURO|nr:hypothetical protein GX51_00466 [Blastomyces parvus]